MRWRRSSREENLSCVPLMVNSYRLCNLLHGCSVQVTLDGENPWRASCGENKGRSSQHKILAEISDIPVTISFCKFCPAVESPLSRPDSTAVASVWMLEWHLNQTGNLWGVLSLHPHHPAATVKEPSSTMWMAELPNHISFSLQCRSIAE